MSRNIFDIEADHLKVLQQLEQYCIDNPQTDGEIPEFLMEDLMATEKNLVSKVQAYIYRINEKEGESEMLKTKAKLLTNKAKVRLNVVERLKNVLKLTVEKFGTVKGKAKSASIDTDENRVSLVKTKKLVVDEMVVPEKYRVHNITFKGLTDEENKLLATAVNKALNDLPPIERTAIAEKVSRTYAADKTAIKHDYANLEEGESIRGVSYEPNSHILIK